jgi:hypothetical protein
MGRIDKFLAKPKKVTIAGEELTIQPLSMKDFDQLMKFSSKDMTERNAAIKSVLYRTIHNAFPEATEAEVDQFGFEYLNDIMNAMLDANNIKMSESDRKKLLAGLEQPTSQSSQG